MGKGSVADLEHEMPCILLTGRVGFNGGLSLLVLAQWYLVSTDRQSRNM